MGTPTGRKAKAAPDVMDLAVESLLKSQAAYYQGNWEEALDLLYESHKYMDAGAVYMSTNTPEVSSAELEGVLQ